ncbi:MAG: aspartate aminotransferase family protein [Geminicoccaceae bacterium]|nr:MAG: aspartate aminotransferase family protein [Geminicoccaceae bacterium]
MSGAPGEGDGNLGPLRAAWRAGRGPAVRALLDRDERVFLRQVLSTPCLEAVVGAEGPWLLGADGARILDFHGNSVHQLGHGHPAVVAAVVETLRTLPFCPRRYTNPSAVRLAERLVAALPGGLGAWKCLLAPSGSVAVGIALKLARYATGRPGVVAFEGSFHGAGLDAASVSGEPLFRDGLGPLLPGVRFLPPPTRGACRFGCRDTAHTGCTEALEELLARSPDVGALIAEPVRWTTVELPPEGYWQRVRAICDRFGVLLILDEIPSALARTGRLFAHEPFAVVPDVLVLGKGLGGGVWPQAAVLARAELDRVPEKAIGHYTHEKSPAGAAAALATLEVIEREDLCGRARRLGAHLVARLETLRDRHPAIAAVRGIGLMLGVELRLADGRPAATLADRVLYASLARGLSFKIGAGHVLTLCPPITIGEAELDAAVAILDAALAEAAAAEGLRS